MVAHLASIKHGPEAVEQLKRSDDMALHQHTGAQHRRHPPPGAHRHLVEPLLQRELSHHAIARAEHVGHVEQLCRPLSILRGRGECERGSGTRNVSWAEQRQADR